MKINIDTQYLQEVLLRLVNTPSPVGDTARGIDACREILCEWDDLQIVETRKGALVATWQGQNENAPRGVTAHNRHTGRGCQGNQIEWAFALDATGQLSVDGGRDRRRHDSNAGEGQLSRQHYDLERVAPHPRSE